MSLKTFKFLGEKGSATSPPQKICRLVIVEHMQSQPGSLVLCSMRRDSNSKEWTGMLGGLGVDVKTEGLTGSPGHLGNAAGVAS